MLAKIYSVCKSAFFVFLGLMAPNSHTAEQNDSSFKSDKIPAHSPYSLTIVGEVAHRDGMGRLPISLTKLLKNDISINFIPAYKSNFQDVAPDIQSILKNPDRAAGKVAILFSALWTINETPADYVPNNSFIKIAYSMLESTAIPKQWVDLLNNKFDLAIVPDEFYRSVYQNAGVRIPIYAQPHGASLEDFLQEPVKQKPSHPFIFGSSGQFHNRKNHEMLIEAFHREFGNDPSVKLIIHGRSVWAKDFDLKAVEKRINSQRDKKQRGKLSRGSNKLTRNIKLLYEPFDDKQYKDFLSSLDCYVLLSKGEGFSITPREALALAKPCIISDCTAHHTIAQTGYVYAVPATIPEPAKYSHLGGYHGVNFNCELHDARKALREVYNNYELYLSKAQEGRKWVQRYLWKNLKDEFLNFIKPKKVILGDDNVVTRDYLMTSSEHLYYKYKQLLDN